MVQLLSGEQGQALCLKAIYWITRGVEREAKSLESEGMPDKAKEKLNEGRKLVAGAMAPHLGNPANEQVEVLIQQLVTMMVPKKRPRAAAPATKPAAVTPADATKKEARRRMPARQLIRPLRRHQLPPLAQLLRKWRPSSKRS